LRQLGRVFRFADEWIDTGVAVMLVAAGGVFAVILAFDGGTALEIGLVALLVLSLSLRWARTSHAWRPLRSRQRRDGDGSDQT